MLKSFNPVQFSNAECEFLLAHLGEPSVKALRDIKGIKSPTAHPKDKNPIIYPDGVIPASVKPVLDGVYELLMLEREDNLKWVGVEAVKTAIRTWLNQSAKWKRDFERYKNAPRWPSLFAFDSKGRPMRGGPGSDSGQVRTYFGPAGERIPFEIDLLMDYVAEWAAPQAGEETQVAVGLKVDPNMCRIECLVTDPSGKVCGHTESYKDGNRSSYNAARARMSKHLRRATDEVDAHRALHANEFGSGGDVR